MTDPVVKRCEVRWTPEFGDFVAYPEVQCTHRGDVEHEHHWSSYEHDLWIRAEFTEPH